MTQNTAYLQGHWDFFHSTGSPKNTANKEYMKGWLDAYKKNQKNIKRKQEKRKLSKAA